MLNLGLFGIDNASSARYEAPSKEQVKEDSLAIDVLKLVENGLRLGDDSNAIKKGVSDYMSRLGITDSECIAKMQDIVDIKLAASALAEPTDTVEITSNRR